MNDYARIVEELSDTAGEILKNSAGVKGVAFANAAAILFEVANLTTMVGHLASKLPPVEGDCVATAESLRKSIEHGVLLGIPTEQWEEVQKLVNQLVDRQNALHARIAAGEFRS